MVITCDFYVNTLQFCHVLNGLNARKKYVSNKAIVVWATVDSYDHTDCNVNLKGWNNAYEIKAKGTPIKTICENIWLKNEKDMKEIATIYSALKVII